MSQLKFWNKQNNNNNNNNKDKEDKDDTKNNGANTEDKKNKKNWLHAPDALVNGHVVYLVKFFGNLPVEQAKGIEVVKDAIRKLQFAQQMKKADTGTQEKFKKVEITISVDGVAVQEPRTQRILHQFPLHNISYCADEKGVKKFFSFIAKNVKPINTNGTDSNSNSINSTNDANEETHECFVFISNKLASDITLTIGQAFDLAYRKYISTAEKSDLSKAQQQLIDQEKTITIYKNRLRELSLKLPKNELDSLLNKMGILDILDLPAFAPQTPTTDSPLTNGKIINDDKLLIDTKSTSSSSTNSFVPIVPPRTNIPSQILHKSSNNSQKMEELLLNSDSDSDFDPRADECLDTNKITNNNGDIFGFETNKSFGHHLFTNNNNNNINNNNNNNNSNNNNNNNNNNDKLQNNNMINGNNKLNSSHSSGNSFINELTPPLLAPPPKISASRRTNSNSFSSNGTTTPGTDLFGSDPFEINANTSIFKNKLNSISVDDFSLESLDPLKK